MSTTIDVYPMTDFMPLVDDTRRRTQELFQQLLDEYGIHSTIQVKAFYPRESTDKELKYVDLLTRWNIDMSLGFAYLINGDWRATSWPSVMAREVVDHYYVEDYEKLGPEYGYPASMLGKLIPVNDEFEVPLTPEDIKRVNSQDHYWFEYRNMGGPAISSIGYGFVAAALAESTEGRISSVDCAFDTKHNGETAEQFLAWWGDEQRAVYGRKSLA